ncbi:MAG TPA: hypothetical protein VLC52_02780 [Anaerolineae bacterium]|nr:hypothetical protein [Anaerolineae bacterium]
MQRGMQNPILRRLEVLVGEWVIEIPAGGQIIRGRAIFEWEEEGVFLVERVEARLPESVPPEWIAQSPFPNVSVFGLDDTSETFSMLYADARGVFRVYQMSLDEGVWKIWRDAPGFFQRFRGTFSPDGNKITAAWERSGDGSTWVHDLDITYTKRK